MADADADQAAVHRFTGGLNAEQRALTGVNVVESVEQTVRRCVEDSADDAIAVIPEGPYVVPLYRPAA
jgi:lactate racemase